MVNLPIVLIVMEKGKRAADINAGGSFHAYNDITKSLKSIGFKSLFKLFHAWTNTIYYASLATAKHHYLLQVFDQRLVHLNY